MRTVLTRLLCLVFALGMATTVAAQATLGSLTGVVRDATGGVIPGVSVVLTNAATGATQDGATNEIGAFTFPQLPPGPYRVTLSLTGFQTRTYSDIVVSVGQPYSLAAQLLVGTLAEAVNVVAGVSLVNVSTPEITSTVGQRQILDIPLVGRDVANLIKLQPGVAGISNRANTVVNGGRPTWTQVTVDGINVQDNFIRTNSLDFLPNRPTSDNVAEFTISTAVVGAETAGGATTVRMVTPSGTNTLRGSVYEFNRDAQFAANSFFNNASGVDKPQLKRNQFGGRAGGPIFRDRLFFFGYYEAFRQRSQTAQNVTIPANADFYNGVFRYAALDGTVRSVNVMQSSGLPIDQRLMTDFIRKVPEPSKVNNYLVGNSSAARILNTAGYRFNQTDLNNRDQFDLRFDFNATARHQFEGVYSYYKDVDDRTDIDTISPDRPLVVVESAARRFAGAWRSTWGTNFQNEARGGGNLSPVSFTSNWDHGAGVLYNTVLNISNPIGGFVSGGAPAASFQSQGRNTDTYQFNDNATWITGRHQVQFGGSWQRNDVNPYNFAGQFPVVSFGFSAAAPAGVQLNATMFPGGISAADLASANAMAAWLGGVVTSVQQTYQVRDTSSGFVAGIPSVDFYTLDNYAAYVQDNWQWKPNFTIRAGLKWEYYAPIREDHNIGFVPVAGGRPIEQVMLDRNATVSFVDGGFYKKDLNNFGPTAGFAWDLTNDGRTVVRGGYSLTFVNEETTTVGRSVARGNSGLSTAVNRTGLYATVSGGVPLPTTPAFLSTRTLADQMALSSSAILWAIDPEIVSPHVHQVSVGIQREVMRGTAVEARYVGTFGREIWRGIDLNQMQMSQAFLADFERARRNGYLAQAAGLGFNPAFNAAVAGSQQLTVLPSFGLLTNATVLNRLQTNQPGALVDFYLTQRVAAATQFLPNQGIYAANLISNGGFSDYNALQLEARRQVSSGFFAQVNYTWSHTNTDSVGTGQNRFEAFMDNSRPELGTGRSFFHQTHVVNAHAIYELPFGQGRRWVNGSGMLNGLIGDWQVSGVLAWQSGSPMTIYSGRGTGNRIGRSDCAVFTVCNTAFSTLTAEQIRAKMGVFTGSDGRLYWIDPAVIDPATGRAVGADNLTNAAGFTGQVFFNPGGTDVGNLPVQAFDGPSQFRLDMALSKRIRFGNRYRLELKAEAFNLTNTPSFFLGDRDINSTTFGRITSVNVGSRVVQWSGRFDF